ncbi:MAG: undecaprenyl-diphosphate phosphatase [Patescibacteria group bacterium]
MVTWWEALILGLVQGFAEFLPVSSSGHLVLAQTIFGFEQPMLFFDVILHFGTLLAVVAYFRKELLQLSMQQIQMIIVGSLPIVGVVFFIQNQVEYLFSSLAIVAAGLALTGLANLATDRLLHQREHSKIVTKAAVGWKEALFVGFAQLLSIVPGISRSGSTVFGGIVSRLDRTTAFRFSFMLSIPAITGAIVLQAGTVDDWSAVALLPVAIGLTAALVSGLFSLRLLEFLIATAQLRYFGYYCLLLSLGLGVYLIA